MRTGGVEKTSDAPIIFSPWWSTGFAEELAEAKKTPGVKPVAANASHRPQVFCTSLGAFLGALRDESV